MSEHQTLIVDVLTHFWDECKNYVRKDIRETGKKSALAKSFCKSFTQRLFEGFLNWKESWRSSILRNLEKPDCYFQEMYVITSLVLGEHIPQVIAAYLAKSAEAILESEATDYIRCRHLCFKPTEQLRAKFVDLLDVIEPKKRWGIRYIGSANFEEDEDEVSLEDWTNSMLFYGVSDAQCPETGDDTDDDGDEIVWESFNTATSAA